MAISKILYMKDCGKGFHGKHLKAALDYISDMEKTQQGRLLGGISCQPRYAYEQMKETKKYFGKVDKRQGYHLIISFQEGEVDADTAFEITERFAKEYLGERYEAVYAVHDNTEHIHSHIVFNSVSFLDGKKYRYEKGDWAKDIQTITNKICEDYGISTIELGNERAKEDDSFEDQKASKNSSFLWSDMIRRDVDICIMQTNSFAEFLNQIKEKGYEVKQNKYLALKGPGMKKYIRLKSLGTDYTEERIRERIPKEQFSSCCSETLEEAERIVYSQIPYGKRANMSRLQKRYYARLYRIGLLKRRPYSQAWKYREEIKEMKRLQEQYLFLVEHGIESREGLLTELESLTMKKREVSSEKRKLLRKRKTCEGLFELQKQMEDYRLCEEEYQSGDQFFLEEHEAWSDYEKKLKEQGYSYEEVVRLREHFRSETARIRKQEQLLNKELRIARSVLKDIEEKAQEKELKEKEKKLEKEQPKR